MSKSSLLKLRDDSPTNDVPALSAVSSAYADIVAKRDSLRDKRAALETRLKQYQAELRASANASKPSDDAQALRVAELLGDPVPVKSGPSIAETISNLKVDIAAVDEALRQIEARRREQRLAASDTICEMVKPRLSKIMNDLIQSTLTLHAANVAFTQFAEDMNGKDVAWGGLNAVFPSGFTGDPRDLYSDMAQFLFEAVREGWLPFGSLPQELRK